MSSTLLHWLLFTLFLPLSLASIKQRGDRFVADVGYFKIPFNDDRIVAKVNAAEKNITDFDCLYGQALDYWFNREDPLPEDVEAKQLQDFANNCTIAPDVGENLLTNASKGLHASLAQFNNDSIALWNDSFTDLSEKYLDAIEAEDNNRYYNRIASYMGVGQNVQCSRYIDDALKDAGEWEKAGAGAAATLMALVPTFLAFGNLYVSIFSWRGVSPPYLD